jgi:hypothetical protein
MSRFEDLLGTQLPLMRAAFRFTNASAKSLRESFEMWKGRLKEGDPAYTLPYRFEGYPDQDQIYHPWESHFLYRDHELTLKSYSFGTDSILRYEWYELDKETLGVRMREQQAQMRLFTLQFGLILDVYECRCTERNFEWSCRKGDYNATASFFGQAFRPLMEAFRLEMQGERESILYPCSSNVEAREINRLVGEHLGVLRYSCLAGKGNNRGMRCEVTLEGYSQEERLQVATYLLAQKRPPIPACLLLCELALRKVIPQGAYDIQA